ncbi:fungal-specific transcription factor domain-containing protein [Paraphoma chrysanthemicola]|uniref:Fungal-specific transcription factor domain-containing protein n=1 Tax=Paraphoma chrysanthemicola TaxID=798071 RepID=A0A8K0QW47_9PLEO|nr:fungal-specific transcription factor domain-containing protein [Paraphoma chrysanthemicola]
MPRDTPVDVQASPQEPSAKDPTGVIDSLACDSCRKSKLRCSRDRPNCLHCRKTGLDCIYQTKRVKPGLKAGAVENIHRRLDELEKRLDNQAATQPDHGQIEQAPSATTVSNSTGDSAAYDILALLAKELPKLIKPNSSQTTSPVSPIESGRKRRRLNYDDAVLPNTPQIDHEPELPPLELLESIVSAYFYNVHPWIPMVHQARFLDRFADDTQRHHLLIVLHSMIIAASKYVPLAWENAHTFASRRKWVVYTAMDSLSVESLQALIIIAFDDIGNGRAAQAWSIVGSLTRTVEYSQLAQEHEDKAYRPMCRPYTPLSPTKDWTELEERRRVFWNVFLLDRFCSVTMGWNTSLTSDDVYRRLPCDGHLWRKQNPVQTPYLGIWDKSRGRIGNPISFMSRYPSPSRDANDETSPGQTENAPGSFRGATDMSTVGALAYNIEATESMSRVMSYFLQQKININDHNDINSWLTRFKELDLRLVHWKMLLPQRWKANPNLTRHVPLMDPNLTTAHVTHNASMILLHQLIAYPPLNWVFRNRLPSTCSAEACYSAGVEIATITEKYLARSPPGSPIGNQYAFCVYIAARALLAHWRYIANNQLPPEFWTLLQSLDEMSRRWNALAEQISNEMNLFASYSLSLRRLYERCNTHENYRIDLMGYTSDAVHQGNGGESELYTHWPVPTPPAVLDSHILATQPDMFDFTTFSRDMLDQNFMEMDRVIAFDDGSMFAAAFDTAAAAW